ncbi:MAG: ATP-dependent DNA helicase [Thermoplasmata archaeon]|nr:ATP-dependent DNA helicase [Thermoplasmata archaeon]MCI4337724.1 ATP-dependent DNA helicase [Thermoplasmata archaeon]MCI4341873.1 ATP-dependent DNA helicase [Thermoplasmata archaeon]
MRTGQERILSEIAALGRSGGPLLVESPTGTGKTVATLAPLLEHAELAGHRVLYLVRTHAQEQQVLRECRAISHRSARPFLALGLAGRQSRCFLLEGLEGIGSATAEEHGKLCGDRKRATERGLSGEAMLLPPTDLPASSAVDLTDLDGCPYYARVLQTELEPLTERLSQKLPTNPELESYCREENLCPYELTKLLARRSRLLTAPYAFFFHPHVRTALLSWLGVGLDRLDLVVDEAHNLPEYLRELASVTLPRDAIRRAREELRGRGDIPFPDQGSASELLRTVEDVVDGLLAEFAPEEDGVLPPRVLEDRLLAELGGTSLRLESQLGALLQWGEVLRQERRQARQLPRSAVHSVALSLLAWPQMEPPEFVKVITREPRPALEAYAVDATRMAAPVAQCHLSVHLSGTLRPLEEYRDALGLPEEVRSLVLPSPFPPENRRLYYATDVTSRYEELSTDPEAIPRLARRLADILAKLPVRTAAFFPSFALLEAVLGGGLARALPAGAVIESRSARFEELWRAVEGFKQGPSGGVLLGVAGGRIAEGIDFPDDELEAVILVGIPFPKPTARREALRRHLDLTRGRGWEYTVTAPAQRAILQALGRLIRSENDRGIGIVLDHRAAQFASVLPGLAPLPDLAPVVRSFFGRRHPRSAGAPSRTHVTHNR